jgi:hypothetical protein
MSSSQTASGGDASTSTITLDELRDMTTVVNIHKSLVRLDEKVHNLEITSQSHSENIDTITHKTFAIPYLERAVEETKNHLNDLGIRHTSLEMSSEKRLNSLGERLGAQVNGLATRLDNKIHELDKVDHTVKSIGQILLALIAGGILVPIVLHFWPK